MFMFQAAWYCFDGVLSSILVLLGGIFAGLTLAYVLLQSIHSSAKTHPSVFDGLMNDARFMSQDENYLQVMKISGDGTRKRNAQKVLNLLQRGKHWVLVTLLLGNVVTNETLAILLDRDMTGGWPAVLTSTALIVIFGEIVPQSVCAKYGLRIAALSSRYILCLMYIMSPFAYPIARILDYLLGDHHGVVFEKAGLKTFLRLHQDILRQDEMNIITAALEMKDKPVSSIMTPLSSVLSLSSDVVLNGEMRQKILNCGYSRIPIHLPGDTTNLTGILLVRLLGLADFESRITLGQLATIPMAIVANTTSCLHMLHQFQQGGSQMALLTGPDGRATGILTLADIMDELVGEKALVDMDVCVDDGTALICHERPANDSLSPS